MSFPFDLHTAPLSDSHLPCPCPCHALTMPFFSRPRHSTAVSRRPCCAMALRRTTWSEHGMGMGMASVNQTRPHCVNQMGKTHSKPLAAWHGRGTAWARHGNGMLNVNRPLVTHARSSLSRFPWKQQNEPCGDRKMLTPKIFFPLFNLQISVQVCLPPSLD